MYFLRIFLSISLTAGLGFGGYAYWMMDEIKRQHAISTERALFDIANILSSQLSSKVKNGIIDTSDFDGTFKNLKKLSFEAVIHDFVIKKSNINVFITDKKKVVLYDSRSKKNVGKSVNWRDVNLTLKGEYGARSTQEDINDEFSHVFYVSSPIWDKNRSAYPPKLDNIIGVVSVSKSTESFKNFVFGGQDRIILMVVTLFIAALTLALLFSYWLTRPISGLIKYAQAVARGETSKPPKTSSGEFQKLGTAFEGMRISLEKKESVKNYVNDVTHALKSPLTTIKATAELLENEVPQDKTHLFSNIEAEAERANKLLNDLLRIAHLETQIGLNKKEKVSLKKLADETLQSLEPLIQKKKINMIVKWGQSNPVITGERFLILQIFENLILNAIEFSPTEGTILIESLDDDEFDQIFVRDQGPGIPEYAKDKIFNKFYSLERPTGVKSTGLGLSFVREALSFHNGLIQLEQPINEMTGANFKLSFPKS